MNSQYELSLCVYIFFMRHTYQHSLFFFKPFWRVWNAAGSGGRGVIGKIFIFYFYFLWLSHLLGDSSQ